MSGIFDLFSRTGNAANIQFPSGPVDAAKKSSAPAMNIAPMAAMAAKNVGIARPKAKGLSIRSKSDLNVTMFSSSGERSPIKKSPIKGQFPRTEIGPFGSVSRQISPRGRDKNSKLQILKSKQLRALSSKSKSPDSKLHVEKMQAETSLFRKPFTPKINRKPAEIYPEPERLAPYCDSENDFYSIAGSLDRDFVRLVSLSRPPVKPFEDEGFESDPEFISQPTKIDPVEYDIEENFSDRAPSLPSISDDDDFDDDFI